ncbi:MAG TPA: type II CAAX endopeptidase family protein [Microbacterium sp.]|nr:type II CAAX endopeptidase family protein [Microbacterium sp.]
MTSPAPFAPPAPVPAVRMPALPADATAGGLAFHRLLFARRLSGWWTPLAVGAIAFVFYVVMLVVVMVIVGIASFADPQILNGILELSENPQSFDMTDPFLLALVLGTIVLMLPSYLLASLIINGKRVGLISSAAGRLRWRWMLLCGAAAVVVFAVLSAVSMLLPVEAPPSTPPSENPLWAVTLVVLLVLVPLQAAAEEYIFRGYLMQSIGRWLRHPAFAILLPVPLFVLGHLYDIWGQVGVGLFAVAAGWLTWRTGGLEAAIALHVVNNLSAFLISLTGGADAGDTSLGPISTLSSAVLIGAYVGVVEWLLRRRARRGRALPRTLVLTPPVPPAPAPYAPAVPQPGL